MKTSGYPDHQPVNILDLQCADFPRAGRRLFQTRFELSSNGEKELNFFLESLCKPGFVLAPNVTSQRVECSYNSDYYEFAWEQNDAPRGYRQNFNCKRLHGGTLSQPCPDAIVVLLQSKQNLLVFG